MGQSHTSFILSEFVCENPLFWWASTFGLCPARKFSPTLKSRLYKFYNYTNYIIYRRVQQLKHRSGWFLSGVHIVFWCKMGHSRELITGDCMSLKRICLCREIRNRYISCEVKVKLMWIDWLNSYYRRKVFTYRRVKSTALHKLTVSAQHLYSNEPTISVNAPTVAEAFMDYHMFRLLFRHPSTWPLTVQQLCYQRGSSKKPLLA
jgi:hypothetical protein